MINLKNFCKIFLMSFLISSLCIGAMEDLIAAAPSVSTSCPNCVTWIENNRRLTISNQDLQQQLEASQKDKNDIQSEYKKVIGNYQVAESGLQLEKQKMQEKLSQQESEIKNITEDRDETFKRYQWKEQQIDPLTQENKQLKISLASREQEKSDIQNQLDTLVSNLKGCLDVKASDSERNSFLERISKGKQYAALVSVIQNNIQERKQLKDANLQLQQQCCEEEALKQEAEDVIKQSNNEIRKLLKQLEETDELRRQLNEAKSEKKNLKQRSLDESNQGNSKQDHKYNRVMIGGGIVALLALICFFKR